MDWKWLFLSFKGRIGRNWWIIGTIIIIAIQLGLSMLFYRLAGSYYWGDSPTIPLIDVLVFLLLIHLFLSIDIKRIHDRGYSAYLLVPLYLFDLFIVSIEGLVSNYDEWIETNIIAFAAILVIYLAYMFWLFLPHGTKGESKYGPDPLGK